MESTVQWDHVGALELVKQALVDTLLLPTTFEPLYRRAPIRLRQGLILTGPPGSGKTLVAQAACSKLQGMIRFFAGSCEKACEREFGAE
jgi:SpoVK/Ycf46/Vps4 family AAA+-type ATPase